VRVRQAGRLKRLGRSILSTTKVSSSPPVGQPSRQRQTDCADHFASRGSMMRAATTPTTVYHGRYRGRPCLTLLPTDPAPAKNAARMIRSQYKTAENQPDRFQRSRARAISAVNGGEISVTFHACTQGKCHAAPPAGCPPERKTHEIARCFHRGRRRDRSGAHPWHARNSPSVASIGAHAHPERRETVGQHRVERRGDARWQSPTVR